MPTLIHAALHCDIEESRRGCVAVIGNMDGVHLGHQTLISETVRLARMQNAPAAAIVFEPHPRRIFQPDGPPFMLTDLATKSEILGDLGIETLFVLPFIEDLYRQTPDEFVSQTLAKRLGLLGIITGSDFQFGAGRAGNVEALGNLARAQGMSAHAISPVMNGKDKYSSSAVREALVAGDPARAHQLLGRPWSIRGPVMEGRRLARTLDFPTANIPLGDYLRPMHGVYVVSVDTPYGRIPGVANIGVRPTVDGTTELLEAHLLDFDANLYGAMPTVHILDFIRPEQKFDGLPALRKQISLDSVTAHEWHRKNCV